MTVRKFRFIPHPEDQVEVSILYDNRFDFIDIFGFWIPYGNSADLPGTCGWRHLGRRPGDPFGAGFGAA